MSFSLGKFIRYRRHTSPSLGWGYKPLKKYHILSKVISISNAFNSLILLELISNLQKLNSTTSIQNNPLNSEPIPSFQQSNIAVILLDAENLQLNINTEKFLATICTYPIQVKVAFANWCNRGKLDIELHERGYDLIHVPSGKDNADGKMIAFGSTIHERYQNIREVLVCSSDKVMTNLCNNLQQHGLIVYQISQQGEIIKILNNSTSEITYYNLKPEPEIPSLETLIAKIKALIKDEQKRTNSYWIELSVIAAAFKNKYNLTLTQVVNYHFPEQEDKNIFINYPTDFVLHQIDENSELYITLFTQNYTPLENPSITISNNSNTSNLVLTKIDSTEDLELALKKIILEITKATNTSYVDVGILSSKFNQHFNKSISKQIKELQINGGLIKFLQSCKSFELKQTNRKWEVSLSTSLHSQTIINSSINSQTDLEQAIKIILEDLIKEAPDKIIDINILSNKFNQRYGTTIKEKIKELQINIKFINFLQSCTFLELKQAKGTWHISLC
ncbi:MAG TPA: NYN domain-containing protein [Nostocaceae cyanobacterium]|nr:NYN domain-containing protein [Nostocaceae cyanobacterium]